MSWLKRVVLKTTVPERVPGVRIPLPPPFLPRSLAALGISAAGSRSPCSLTPAERLKFESLSLRHLARAQEAPKRPCGNVHSIAPFVILPLFC